MKSLIIFFAIICTSQISYTQSSPDQIIDKFFQDLATEKPDKVLDNFYTHMPWVSNIKVEIDKLKTNFATLQTYFGKYNGNALIVKKEIGNGALVIYSYLIKYERQPVRFTFKFYKPKDVWLSYSFSYDMSLDDELEQAVKLQNIK